MSTSWVRQGEYIHSKIHFYCYDIINLTALQFFLDVQTTLLDVIAMRKTSGDIEGEIRLNGFLQERTSFLRCSGVSEVCV